MASEPNRDRAAARSASSKHPLRVLFCLVPVLPRSKRRCSAGSMRVDSEVNADPVDPQSRIATEPAGEKRLQNKPQKPQCFGAFFDPALCSFAKLDTKWTQFVRYINNTINKSVSSTVYSKQ